MSEVCPWAAIKDDLSVAVALEYEDAVLNGVRVFRTASLPEVQVAAINRFLAAYAEWGRMSRPQVLRVGVLICERYRLSATDTTELMARIDRAGEMAKASPAAAMASSATPC